MGPLISAGAAASGSAGTSRPARTPTAAGGRRVPRQRAGGAGLLVPADRRAAAVDGGPGLARGGVRPGGGRRCRSTTRRTPIALANDTEYGLSGSIWTRDIGRALRVARAVESGNLSVNSNSSVRYWTPFGGFKRPGWAASSGRTRWTAFTEVKNVFIATRRG